MEKSDSFDWIWAMFLFKTKLKFRKGKWQIDEVRWDICQFLCIYGHGHLDNSFYTILVYKRLLLHVLLYILQGGWPHWIWQAGIFVVIWFASIHCYINSLAFKKIHFVILYVTLYHKPLLKSAKVILRYMPKCDGEVHWNIHILENSNNHNFTSQCAVKSKDTSI